jgi:hypothetical protein
MEKTLAAGVSPIQEKSGDYRIDLSPVTDLKGTSLCQMRR